LSQTRLAAPFLALILTMAFAAAAVAQTLTADEKVLATYRLTMPNIKKVFTALESMVQEMTKDPKFQEQQKLKGQIKALQDKDELTDAQQAELEKLQERAEALEEEIDKMQEASGTSNMHTLDQMEASIKKQPFAMRALNAQGLTPREYALTLMALLQASMADGFLQGQDLSKLPPGINPENVKFVRENKDALAAMQTAFKKFEK
jgi:septal ring factor EnvC (AmiA/AmiB activator)